MFGATTTLTQTVVNPDGTPASGTVYIRPSAACQSGSDYVGNQTVSVTFSGGAFSVSLVPNDTCVPSGTSYTASWALAGGAMWVQTWNVPTSSSPVSVDSVVVGTVSAPAWVTLWFSQHGPGTTAISQTVVNPDGTPASGQALIRPNGVCKSGPVYVGDKTVAVKFTGGLFNVSLMPNDTCVPSGTSYSVSWSLTGGRAWTETWVVPTGSAPVEVGSVVVTTTPLPSYMVQWQQLAQNGAQPGQSPTWSGSAWVPGFVAGASGTWGQIGGTLANQADLEAAITPGGDLSGALTSATVAKLQGKAVSSATPSDGQMMRWSASAGQWQPVAVRYTANFTGQTSITVLGATHNLGTADLTVSCYSADTPPVNLEPNGWVSDPTTFDVTVYFPAAWSGRCVLR